MTPIDRKLVSTPAAELQADESAAQISVSLSGKGGAKRRPFVRSEVGLGERLDACALQAAGAYRGASAKLRGLLR